MIWGFRLYPCAFVSVSLFWALMFAIVAGVNFVILFVLWVVSALVWFIVVASNNEAIEKQINWQQYHVTKHKE